jgi:hypothetical protein
MELYMKGVAHLYANHSVEPIYIFRMAKLTRKCCSMLIKASMASLLISHRLFEA